MKAVIISIFFIFLAIVLGYTNSWLITPMVVGLTYAIAALGVSVMMRAGQVSFGHAMYACISAYTVAFVARAFPQADALVLILSGVFVSFLASALFGAFIVRYRSIFFGMLNLAISMVLFAMLGKMYTITGGTDGLRFDRPSFFWFDLPRKDFELVLLVVTLLISGLLALWVQRYFRSGSGEALSAIKTNETRLEYLGFSTYSIMWRGYVFSGVLVGFSGALLGLIQGLATPEIGVWLRSGEYVFIAILGGAAHAAGAFLGAAGFEVVKLVSAIYFPEWWQFALGLTLILAIFVVPNGIYGLVRGYVKTGGEK